jgi:hypothetical protein
MAALGDNSKLLLRICYEEHHVPRAELHFQCLCHQFYQEPVQNAPTHKAENGSNEF